MKKRRLLKLICSLCLMCFATLTLAACEGAGNPVARTEEGAGYTPGGGPDSAPSATPPGGGSSDSDVEVDEEGNLDAGMTVDFSQYFKGYTVLTNGNSAYTVKDENGNDVLFNDLLDRQFDILAQDLIYRLTFVYGDVSNRAEKTVKYSLKLVDGTTEYTYNSNKALIDKTKVLSSSADVAHSSHTATSVNVNCADCYQMGMYTEDGGTHYFSSNNNMMLSDAIEGRYLSMQSGANGLLDTVVTPWTLTVSDSTYGNYLAAFKNNFKMAIAQILSEKTVNGTYSATEYDKLLNSINTLGYFIGDDSDEDAFANKLIDFINKGVIGTTNIERDERVYNSGYFSAKNHVVDSSFAMGAPYNDTNQYTTDEIANSPRLYKGYKVVVPAIVKEALSNNFEGTTTNIYPHFARVSGSIGTFETYDTLSKDQNGEVMIVQNLTTTGSLNLNSIILMPQQGAAPISLGLQIDVARALTDEYPAGLSVDDANYINYFARDIVVELEVDITYKVGSTLVNISKAVADESKGSSVITLDSKTGYIMKQLDYNDPNFDPNKASKDEAYKEQFMRPVPNPDGKILPYDFTYSLYEHFENEIVPPLDEYTGYNPLIDTNTLWDNSFVKDDANGMIYLDAGPSYIQINFNIVSIKKYAGDNNSQLVDYVGNDVVFDITVKPYT